MKIQIITWNVRGLNDSDKRRVVKAAIRKWNAYVICLQETKLASITDEVVKSLWGGRFVEWETLNASGTSGGILIMWDRRWLSRIKFWKGLFSLLRVFQMEDDNFSCPLLIMINLFFGKSSTTSRNCGHCLGAAFTWSSGRDSVTLSRLDRFLVSGDWEEKFPDVTQAALVRVMSNHVPLVLDCRCMRSRRTPFQFENMWLRSEDFQGKVQSWWGEAMFTGSANYVLAKKFRILKYELKKWNKEVFGNFEWKKNRILADIAKLNRLDELGQDMESLRSRRASCQTIFAKLAGDFVASEFSGFVAKRRWP
ncbi:uncharacterized protein LOC132266231 [Cornus florida]|uniref:uncharacterized protein LOC132266231 n=1 Tax=Cornus florida TaxID=4283 RepID=UPI002899390A|nr:uncharacterized protein LOC132266231 [Cornus florida]